MRDDLQRRLRELGVVKGVRELATLPTRPQIAIEDLVPGRFHTTSHGRCFVVESTYPLEHRHGDRSLSQFLDLKPGDLAQLGQDQTLNLVDPAKACFIDTETTGLSGGAGTMAFMVGLGFFEAGAFHVHQYFLRDPGDEPAMVETLAKQLFRFEYLVSFNGITFDVPILENRFILARIPPPTGNLPHLDLLHPARRLWRYALPSCALGSLEVEVLGVQREQADVPGGVIPYLYRDYLRTGDAREMKRVLYHNEIDVLSLATLAVRLHRAFADPWGETVRSEPELGGAEFYGLARWYARDGRDEEAERAYRVAIAAPLAPSKEDSLPPDVRARALRDLGLLLKRAGRRDEAFGYWQQLALESRDDVGAHVELAKHFEWHVENLALAAGWTRAALAQVSTWPPGLRRDTTEAELVHRLERLERKTAASTDDDEVN
ncbi:MAG TPA: hypothetical protein ENN19_06125 [Chloroflexi bacterium]|nr:hypothetical protein [Chloroflexota bacterium]